MTLPTRIYTSKDPTPINYQAPVLIPIDSKPVKVCVWEMVAGRVTKLKMGNELIVVRDTVSNELTPAMLIELATRFFEAFDIGKSVMINKASVKQEPASKQVSIKSSIKRTKEDRWEKNKLKVNDGFGEDDEVVGRIRSITIYKVRIREFYKLHPDEFTTEDFLIYLESVYKGIAGSTADNRGRTYIKFLTDNGFAVLLGVSSKGRRSAYKFVAEPYPAAQAEFDPEYAKDQKLAELDAMRRND